jgi:hypothetical protein
MATVFVEARPKGRPEGSPIEDYVVEGPRGSRPRKLFLTVVLSGPISIRPPCENRRCFGLHPPLRCPSSVQSDSSAAWLARENQLY